ncbi:NAD-dependent epimerase/dehydratase family protein [Gilvibacter sediminis]|uniref:NAD-dependent epimerase/dehydratase family protein n=1 Tax=Gilvibacter sediminis TaxID=379071 RepID=UPI002350E2D2|nr:NAD-dependent epimerase/dehydratase family protein [Gilvibacter sediminis]MDC7996629.1 NAD-dependent epimerase/dehydratase family protein [Gilvibacter sediminis]
MLKSRILVLGGCGQLGTELVTHLRAKYGAKKVIVSDIKEADDEMMAQGPFEVIDATDYSQIEDVVIQYEITEVYLLAAMLSATGEKFPEKAWQLNMTSLFNVLDLAKDGKIEKVFWPSSIAVFGESTPKDNTPQQTIMEPSTVYGISKLAGERWCEYYHRKFGVDVRSIRYPGLISYKTAPGGGTTDYAVDIFHKALKHDCYVSFLNAQSELPMMYIEDAINATISIMDVPREQIKVHSSYNLSALSFTPEQLAAEIKKQRPDFKISYDPDFRQEIADSWPNSIDDSEARNDWGWDHQYGIEEITEIMLRELGPVYAK